MEREGYAIAVRDDLRGVVREEAFREQMRDVLEYRVLEYYRRRYVEK